MYRSLGTLILETPPPPQGGVSNPYLNPYTQKFSPAAGQKTLFLDVLELDWTPQRLWSEVMLTHSRNVEFYEGRKRHLPH